MFAPQHLKWSQHMSQTDTSGDVQFNLATTFFNTSLLHHKFHLKQPIAAIFGGILGCMFRHTQSCAFPQGLGSYNRWVTFSGGVQCTSSLSGTMDTTNLRMCRYNLKIVHQHRMDRLPMVLQELPKGLHSYISLPRYASMKSHVDNVLLQVYMVTRRLRYLTLVSSCILVLSLFSYFVLLLIHIQDPGLVVKSSGTSLLSIFNGIPIWPGLSFTLVKWITPQGHIMPFNFATYNYINNITYTIT